MNVLVIGGNRFVGRLLTWRLLARGDRVTLFNRGTLADPFGDRVERLRGDRRTGDFARHLAGRRFDATVDFAAFTGSDVQGVLEVLGERAGHYVFISTGQVYLVRGGCPRPSREQDYAGPLIAKPAGEEDLAEWEYGVWKRDGEDLLARTPSLRSTRLRIPMVSGERDYHRRIEGYLRRLLDGGPLLVPDGGVVPTRHVYGDDVARAIVDWLGREETFGGAYNLAQVEAPTLSELLEKLAALLGAPLRRVDVPVRDLEAAGLRPVEVSPFSARWMSFIDPSLAVSELGFRHTPLDEYLGRVVASFRAHPPGDLPRSYARRPEELELARRLGSA